MVFSEDSRVKIPCILHLVRLGYRYLSFKNASLKNIPPERSCSVHAHPSATWPLPEMN